MQPPSFRARRFRCGLWQLVLAAGPLAAAASADVLTHTTTIPLATTNWSHVALLPRFNPALGTLEAVSVSLSGHIEGTARYENLDSAPAQITIDFMADMKVRRPDTNAVLLSSTPVFHHVEQAAAFDGTIDFAGPSGSLFDTISSDATMQFVPPFPLDTADTMLFVGAGNAVFTVIATGNSVAMGSGNLVVGFTQSASAALSVTYTFTPPFIQDCNNNGIVDEDDITAGTSPDCNMNGIPDECEILGNDCNDNGIPDECDLATGILTDLNMDGFPDQCTCVRVDRNHPASLLLWPEFDNQPGMLTLLTVTNTNRHYFNGHVRVEFRYIDSETCLETNRTHVLTPNDTITVATRAHVGGENRGYAYAYACEPGGTPISFNFLMGAAIVLDGVSALDYAMNAFVWRAIPPVRHPTDLDMDGIRDLNGHEYEPSPDIILIPRFLGQDATTSGQMLFVALSGGGSFTTTVDLQIFNDNEDPFSAQYTFQCWAKAPLLSISGMFSNSMLHASDDDPDEVFGDPATEAGWLRLDGRTAVSSLVTIHDPAILAVLIEGRGAFSTSDLPYEQCTQTNGGLLPLGPLGDTNP